MSSLHHDFQRGDAAADAEATFGWLDRADAHPVIRKIKQRLLAVCPVGDGDQVLDVGCGIGHEVRRLAERVGSQGQVVGIDANPAMIGKAKVRAAGWGLPVSFDVGDARGLSFGEGTFDLCRTERMLRYIDAPEVVLAEMMRVTRPGGSVLAFDFDSDTTVVNAPDPALTSKIAGVLDAAVPRPWIGRQLFGMFQQAGLSDVRVVPHAMCVTGAPGLAMYTQLNRGTIDQALRAGLLTDAEVGAWWDGLRQAAEDGTFLVANLGFIVAGYRP